MHPCPQVTATWGKVLHGDYFVREDFVWGVEGGGGISPPLEVPKRQLPEAPPHAQARAPLRLWRESRIKPPLKAAAVHTISENPLRNAPAPAPPKSCGLSRSVGPNVVWLCQQSPRMTCPVGLLRGSAVPETGLLPVPLTGCVWGGRMLQSKAKQSKAPGSDHKALQ